MRTKSIFEGILLVAIMIALLYSLCDFWPESYASFELPERVYEAYGINTQEVFGDCSIKYITVCYDGEIKKFFSRSHSPITALIDSGYSVSNRNRVVSTSPITRLHNNAHIQVYTYKSTIDEILLEIPFETILKGSVLCKSLSQEVKEQDGVLGIMSQRIKRTYKGGMLIAEEIIEENIQKEPRPEIVVIKGPGDLPNSVPQRGYDCNHWNLYIDNNVNTTDEIKQWLKFMIMCESGCNAESNKSFYKGLFQWHPCLWYKQYPNDNIFDGEIQIKRVLEKLNEGANPNQTWPGCHRSYKNSYGELSWFQ